MNTNFARRARTAVTIGVVALIGLGLTAILSVRDATAQTPSTVAKTTPRLGDQLVEKEKWTVIPADGSYTLAVELQFTRRDDGSLKALLIPAGSLNAAREVLYMKEGNETVEFQTSTGGEYEIRRGNEGGVVAVYTASGSSWQGGRGMGRQKFKLVLRPAKN